MKRGVISLLVVSLYVFVERVCVSHRSITLSVAEFCDGGTVVAMLDEKSLARLTRPETDAGRFDWPRDGVPGIDDPGVGSPLSPPVPRLSRRRLLRMSSTSPNRRGVLAPVPEPCFERIHFLQRWYAATPYLTIRHFPFILSIDSCLP